MTFFTEITVGLAALTMQLMPVEVPTNFNNTSVMHTTETMHRSSDTGNWLATCVRDLDQGDRIDGEVLRQFVDPNDFTGGEQAVSELIQAVDYLLIEKPSSNKIAMITYLKGEENIKRKFEVEGDKVKVELRHQKTRLLVERLSASKVQLKIRGIGAAFKGAPIPESIMRMVVAKERLETIEVLGFDIDQNERITLPKVFQKEES